MAALWKLPLIAMCENNLYAVETHISQAMAGESVAARASGFGLPAETVDGQDVLAVYAGGHARPGTPGAGRAGPTFIEAQTYRYEGHNVGDVQNYGRRAKWPTGARRVTRSTGCASGWPGRANWTMAVRRRDLPRGGASWPTRSLRRGLARGPTAAVNCAWPAASEGPDAERLTYSQAYRAGLAEEMAGNEMIFVHGHGHRATRRSLRPGLRPG